MRLLRAALLIAAVAGLLLGMWAGLVRLGWPWPPLAPVLPMLHGPLMACGFLGTLIGVERAVGTGKRWAYLGPALVALGVLLALLGAPGQLGPLLVTLGSAIVALVLIGLARLQPANYTVTMAVGGGAWVVGNLLWWLGWPLYVVALWWMGFLVLTIAGERLELSRMRAPSKAAVRTFGLIVALLLLAFAVASLGPSWAIRLMGLALLALAAWLASEDVARRTVRGKALTRFIAVCLLSGYVWLAVSAEGTGRPRLPVGACIEARKGRMRDSTPVSTLNRPSSNSSTALWSDERMVRWMRARGPAAAASRCSRPPWPVPPAAAPAAPPAPASHAPAPPACHARPSGCAPAAPHTAAAPA